MGQITASRGIVLHSDAAQAVGKVPIDIKSLGVDLMSITAHKMYGPKGIGALYIRRRRPRPKLKALFDGGGHENGLRPGTVNVPGAVGFGAAAGAVAGSIVGAVVSGVDSIVDQIQDDGGSVF